MRANRWSFLFACLLFPGLLSSAASQTAAQTPAKPPSAASSFADEPFVVQKASTVYVIKADGTGYQDNTVAVKLQSDAAVRSFGVVSISFASQSQHVEIHYARVRRPDGTVVETPAADALEEPAPVTREAPFYSDLKTKELPIKNLHVGDTLEWETRILRTVAEAPGQFWGAESFVREGVTLSQDIELRVPVALHPIVWTNPKETAATETVDGAERVFHWHGANLKPTVGPQAEAAKKAAETHVLTADEEKDNTEGPLPSAAWTTFPDWAAVGAWYRKLEASRIVPDDAIQAKVNELIAGKSTQEEKARAVYAYVATQIRYIGVALGIGRYQPHMASDVLSNQYGDCKDKHTLLAAMLSAAGISSDAVLIGDRVRFNAAVPSPAAFNHLITRAHLDPPLGDVWLDATAEVAPFRALNPDIRDKSALVVPDTGTADIARSPEYLPYAPNETWTAIGSLDAEGISDSHITIGLHDDVEIIVRSVLHQISAAQYNEFLTQFAHNMGYAGTATHPDFTRPDDLSQPFSISFDYHREKGGDWDNLRVLPQLMPIGLPTVDDKQPPTSRILLGQPRTLTSNAQMKLPPGWRVELPEAVHAKSSYATFDTTYRFQNGILYTDRKVVILKSKIPASDWKAYKKFQDDADLPGEPYIQLVRGSGNSGTRAGDSAPAPTISNAQAAKLVDEAWQAEHDKQTDKALELLNQAKAINPQQRSLWGYYGFRAYDLGMTSEAIEDYRKELTFHPDATWVYQPLAEELLRNNRKEEAIAALRSWVAADPKDPDAPVVLVRVLAFEGDTQGAIAAGGAAMKELPADDPKSAPLQIALANAQLDAGANADAAANAVAVLKFATDPDIKNSAAYLLSETGLHLPEAEAAERSVLDSLAAETSFWTLDEAAETLKQKSGLLFASWDTMGWILFREGHVKEARKFVEAAWRNRQDIEIGHHLGDIALADNDPNAAMKVYELALYTTPARGRNPLPATVAKQSDEIRAAIARAKKAGAKSQLKDISVQLQTLRTITLGPANGHFGSAEYRILLSGAKAEATRPVDKPIPGGDAILASSTFAGLIPQGETAKIVLFGYLNCVAGDCEFVVEP